MKSLFWRYLLTQWAALLLLLVLSIGLTTYFSSHRTEALNAAQPTNMVLNALRIASQEGEAGLKEWVRDINRQQIALTIYILNAQDEDILGQEIHPRLLYSLKLARQGANNRHSTKNLLPTATWWQTHLLTLPDGGKLRLIFLPYDNSRWDLLSLLPVSITLILLALAITFIFCLLMARYVAWPIEQLGQATRRLAAGHLHTRAPVRVSQRQDALGSLAQDFNTMASRLQSQLEAKEELLRHIAHELRSPLTRLQLAVELAKQKSAPLERQLERIRRESERLDTRLKHILQLARSSELAGSCQHFDLVELIEEIISDSAYECQKPTIHWSPPPEPILFFGDRHNLHSAIENVIRNAVLYAGHAGPICVQLLQDGQYTHIYVRDKGSSLRAQDIAVMFEPFQRSMQHRHQEGTGLGLSISKACIQAHGGEIFARLLPHQQGFEVHLQLPLD